MQMQPRNDYEIEINLKDLFFHILYRWRVIVILALVAAAALAFWQNYKIDSVHARGEKTAEEEQFEIDLITYRNNLANAESTVAVKEKAIADMEEYLANSVWLNLDKGSEYQATRVYHITADPSEIAAIPQGSQMDPADYAVNTYATTLMSGLSDEELLDLFGTSRREYVNELVSVSGNTASNDVTIRVVGGSREYVDKIMDFFAAKIAGESGEKAQELCRHTVKVLTDDVVVNENHQARQTKRTEYRDSIQKMQEDIAKARADYNSLIRKKEPKAPGKHILRYAVIGGVLGVLLPALFFAVMYVLGGRIHSAGEVTGAFGVPVLGSLAHSRARRPGKGIDKLIENWEFRHAERDAGRMYDAVAALLREQDPAQPLLLTGTVGEKKLRAAAEMLSARLPAGTELRAEPDFVHRPEAVSALGEAGSVLLVEEKHETRTAEMVRMGEMLSIGGAKVFGCILL